MKNLAIFCFIFAFLGSHLIAGKSVGNSVNLKENLVSKDDVVENPEDQDKSEPTVNVNTNSTDPNANPDDPDKSEPTVNVNTNSTDPNANPDDPNKSEPTVNVNTNSTDPNANPDDPDKSEPTVNVNTNSTDPNVIPGDSNNSEPTVDVITVVPISTNASVTEVSSLPSEVDNSTSPATKATTSASATEKTTHKPAIEVSATDGPGTTKAPTTEALVKHKYKMSGGATAGIIVAVLAVFVVLGGVYYHYSSKRLPKTKNTSMSLKESRSKAFNKDS